MGSLTGDVRRLEGALHRSLRLACVRRFEGRPIRFWVERRAKVWEGTWAVKNTIDAFSMPLGSMFVDGFTRAIAEEDVNLGDSANVYFNVMGSESDHSEVLSLPSTSEETVTITV